MERASHVHGTGHRRRPAATVVGRLGAPSWYRSLREPEGIRLTPDERAGIARGHERTVLDQLRPVLPGVALVLLLTGLVEPLAEGRTVLTSEALIDVATAAAVLGVWWLIAVTKVGIAHPHRLAGGVALLILANLAASLVATGIVLKTAFWILFAVGVGVIFLSTAWTVAVLAATGVAWTAVALVIGDAGWMPAGFALLGAIVIGGVVHVGRLRVATRLEVMNLRQARAMELLRHQQRDLEAAYQTLAESQQRTHALLASAPVLFIGIDDGHVITHVEGRMLVTFGRRLQALIGRHVDAVPPDLAPLAEGATEALDGRRSTTSVRILGRPFQVHWRPVLDAGGRIVQAVGVALDVADHELVEKERVVSLRRLHELQNLREMHDFKTRFINMAAHELNTPLTPIAIHLHLLDQRLGDHEDARVRRSVHTLQRNMDRLGVLVTDVLDAARLQSDRLKVEAVPTDLAPVIRDALDTFREAASAGEVELLAGGDDAKVHADPRRVTQVLDNLVSNALKFTPPGGTVRVDVEARAHEALVRVSDAGRGLTKDEQSRLFEPFSQVHAPGEDAAREGTGLGLYISKGIIEAHGGRIWVESEGRGRGSTFAFTLPTVPS